MRTLGFVPDRTSTGASAILWDPDRLDRLCKRYRIKWVPRTLDSASVPSDSSVSSVNAASRSEATEATEANPEGGLFPQKRDSMGGPLSCEYCGEEWPSNEGYRKHVCPVGPKAELLNKWS